MQVPGVIWPPAVQVAAAIHMPPQVPLPVPRMGTGSDNAGDREGLPGYDTPGRYQL